MRQHWEKLPTSRSCRLLDEVPMKIVLAFALAALLSTTAAAAPAAKPVPAMADDGKPWPEAQIEIFKLAPGKQEAFLRDIARADEVSAAGGQPPITLYIHEDGADWDVLLLKPFGPDPTPAQQAAMDAKAKVMNMESGPAYFVRIRQQIASHTDTRTYGPVSAAQWVARLDGWRAAHPDAAK
jgi:hypothetical protein